jgi:hypothetical protein
MKRGVILLVGLLLIQAVGRDIDSGSNALQLAKALENSESLLSVSEPIGWVRLRGLDLSKESEIRVSLAEIRNRGLKTCVLMRWPADGGKLYLPTDLREAFENGRKLGATYGDLINAWEVDNEPDLGFVPESAENYTAFLKATYLGLKVGSREQGVGGKSPLVLMGALGLPPGPWIERFAANDGFGYTDGFNCHYYGYADDFTAVYRQFEDAVAALTAKSEWQRGFGTAASTGPTFRSTQHKALPVFLTEIGYGMLGKESRNTKEGRLRQWQWFRSVGEQANQLKIEAPMAFHLPPYLEFDTLEFGLTVPAAPQKAESGKLKAEESKPSWIAGGISYSATDFQASSAESWMEKIGAEISGNEATPALAWWLTARKSSGLRSQVSGLPAASRSWTVSAPAPSPVVIDFLTGEGLSFVKRYNGSFVVGRGPVPDQKAESGKLKAEAEKPVTSTKPTTGSQQPSTPPRAEEFIIHVRTQNGNLYEVYPTRMAKSEWVRFFEPGDNFTMSFYGRAELPWRFKENKPASLVVVMYPKQLPATYEFRRAQLLKLEARSKEQGVKISKAEEFRYGSGKVVLYNFSDKPVSGRLVLPEKVERVVPTALSSESEASVLTLAPGERCEIEVSIQMPVGGFERIEAPMVFIPEDQSIPPARFVTSFISDIAGVKATEVAALLQPKAESGRLKDEDQAVNSTQTNREIIASRVRATEEAPMTEQGAESKGPSGLPQTLGAYPLAFTAFAQQGAVVERTSDGFTVTVTERPPGKEQRVEVEIPWPEGLVFDKDSFLSAEFRLKP